MISWMILTIALTAVSGTEQQYFTLRHEELSSLSIDVENGDSPAAGKALAIRRRVAGLQWYEDAATGSVRTADSDLCVQADQGGTLKLGQCGSNDWDFYQDRNRYISGLVASSGGTPGQIAVWESDEDIYTSGANIKITSKPFESFKNDYGAAWIKKTVSLRVVNLQRLRSMLRRLATVVAVRAGDSKSFYLSHVEFSPVVVAVEGGNQAAAGKMLVAHFAQNSASEALMFQEDTHTQNIVTVNGGLCITNSNGGLQLTPCQSGNSFYRLKRSDSGRVQGVVRGSGDSMTIAAYGDQTAIMKHEDDPLVGLSFSSNKNKFSTMFVPRY